MPPGSLLGPKVCFMVSHSAPNLLLSLILVCRRLRFYLPELDNVAPPRLLDTGFGDTSKGRAEQRKTQVPLPNQRGNTFDNIQAIARHPGSPIGDLRANLKGKLL